MPTTATSGSQRPLTLLSLDGGGYRGLALLYQLKHIMCRLPGVDPSNKLYPHKYFDLIGGASTGGLIALMFGRLGMDIDSAIQKYRELGSTIFGGNSGSLCEVLVSGGKFDADPFENALKRWLNELSLLDPDVDLRCCCFVTTVPNTLLTVVDPIILRSYPSPRSTPTAPHGHGWLVWEAARATSATSTYFPPLDLGGGHVFKDASILGVNNPALLVLKEAAGIPAFFGRPVGCLVSLGTGLSVLTRPNAPSLSDTPAANDLLQRVLQRTGSIATNPAEAYRRLHKLRNDLVTVATNTENTHREVAEQFRTHLRRLGNQPPLYLRLNPFGSLGNTDLADFTRGAGIELLTSEYLGHPDVGDNIEGCAIVLEDLRASPTPAPTAVVFRPLYRTGFEVDPFTCSPDEIRELYRDLLPREPLIGYRSSVGNGAFTLEFEGLKPVRWRSFLNADVLGPVRVGATVDLGRCTTINARSGAGVLVILPDENNVCYDLFFLVEPSVRVPLLHVLRVGRPANGMDNYTALHCESLPHCSGEQIVQVEVTLLNDVITVSTNSVASAWSLSTPISGGPNRLRAFGLCGIGPKRITWTSFELSVAEAQDPDQPSPPQPPTPSPRPTPRPPQRPSGVHPHTLLDLPAVRAIPLQPVLFTKIIPALDVIMAKLLSFVDALHSPPPTVASARKVFSLHVLPFLKSRFPPAPANPDASVPIPPNLLADWKKATVDLFGVFLPEQLMPLVDLWRVALLDERVSKWGATEDGSEMIQHMFLKVASIRTNGGNLPWNLLITTLRLAANCFSSDPLGQYLSSSDTPSRAAQTSLLVFALLDFNDDALVRNAAATLAFNEAVLHQKPFMNDDSHGSSGRDEDWEAEMVSALVEALHKEEKSEDVVYRLTASLALFLYLSPFYQMLAPLTEVLQAKYKLHESLHEGRYGGMGVHVRDLIEEVADELCT